LCKSPLKLRHPELTYLDIPAIQIV